MQRTEPTTLQPGESDPTEADLLVSVLSEQIASSERQTEAIGALARLIASGDRSVMSAASRAETAAAQAMSAARSVEASVRVVTEQLGSQGVDARTEREERRRMLQQQGLLLNELRGALRRLGPLELEVAHMREERLAAAAAKTNGTESSDH